MVHTAVAGFEELLRPGVIQAFGDAFATAQRGDAVLAAQPLQHDADLVLGRVMLAGGAADVSHDLLGAGFGHGDDGFLAHLHSPAGYAEPKILHSSTSPRCLMGADAEHPVPDAIGPGAPVTERLRAAVPVAVVPSIKGRPRDAELLE